ncbi:MAG: DUF1361 domain-containing protein [Spirochaetaceae bacterium]|jgi:uncharacterized membrane protein|nr:DUF1361 domain-containing protein [Spirochaetaceae bacterium]
MILKLLKDTNRLGVAIQLLILSVFCFGLTIIRYIYTDGIGYFFLLWNLFLAFIPWLITGLLIIKPGIKKSKIVISLIFIVWFLFFPNAFYIITDLMHLRKRSAVPIWFDMFLILSFSWTGFLFGFYSLLDIEQIMQEKFSKKCTYIFTVIIIFAASYGIFLGRYIRLNSWDIIASPVKFILTIKDTIINPAIRRNAFAMTFITGIFLNMIYWSLHMLKQKTNSK